MNQGVTGVDWVTNAEVSVACRVVYPAGVSDSGPESSPEGATPPPLTVAASLVALQAVVLLGVAVVELVDLAPDRRALGVSTALFFTVYGALLAAAAWALWQQRGWSRGPVLLTQLIQLGLAWNLRDLTLLAIALAVTALVAIAGTIHPDSVAALEREPDDAG